MGRFPWSQGHSKQGSDKLHALAHDWFSKENAEPSRQALNDLVKDCSSFESGNSDESPKARGRSRADTVNSSFSLYTRSLSDTSNDLTSRPSSRQSFVDNGLPLPERHESAAKALLSKGTRMLRRQGSRLNLLPSQMEERPLDVGEGRAAETSPVKEAQRQPNLSSRRTGLKRSISGPFAFQHVTHGDQAQFQSLDSVSKTELTSEFNAIQADQEPVAQIRGIPVADLPTKGTGSAIAMGLDEPTSPTTNAIPYLPATPPRPQPPPKDCLMSPYSPSDFRMSRSMENFSRPTRLSATATDISPSSDITGRLSTIGPLSWNSVAGKPLPQLPDIIHAVSTRDDIALPLRTAPLPSPPKAVMEVVEEERLDEGVIAPTDPAFARPSIGDLIASPTVRQRKRRSQSSGEIHFDPLFYDVPPAITGAAADQANPKSKARLSVGVKPIDIGDWEDAIDYSWEHAVDLEDAEAMSDSDVTVDRPRAPGIPHENYLVVEQKPIEEASSSASTPLMMQGPNKPEAVPLSSDHLKEEPPSSLLGLGIGSFPLAQPVSLDESTVKGVDRPESQFNSTDLFRPRVLRSPDSSMSKSSSQESIILSIASSIIGTHRSSNSSTSLSDFAHLANFGDSVENLKLDLQGFTFSPDNRLRECSQDTIREGSENISIRAHAHRNTSEPSTPFPGSPTPKHEHTASASQLPIPERKSSVPGVDISKTQVGRKRAGTGTLRPRRNTRVSYSLFPATSTN